MGGVVGREAELSAIEGFLDVSDVGVAALALEGEAGIGKTTLWREAIRRARARGFRVLVSQPAQSEARLSFAGIGDLLGAVEDDVFDALPGPQRRALEVALLRADPFGAPPDERSLSVSVVSLFKALTARSPVLVAVDDVQWLDGSTAAVLEFAARRLDDEPLRLLVSERVTDEPARTFERSVGADRRSVVRIGPLSVAALHQTIRQELGHAFPRPVLVRIERASGGNPFYALEIARELLRAGVSEPGARLPVPDDMRTLVRNHIRRLPQETRDALLIASMLTAPTIELVDEGALGAAEEAGIATVTRSGGVEFTHPLYASAVYALASPRETRNLHRRLAELVDDIEERARHLALGNPGLDDTVARTLAAAADRARSRGANAAAAELYEQALERLREPASIEGLSWQVELSRCLLYAGDRERAQAGLARALDGARPGDARSSALLLLGTIVWLDADPTEGTRLALAALEDTADRTTRAAIHRWLSWMYSHDVRRAADHARLTLELIDENDDPGDYSCALLELAKWRLVAGEGADQEAVDRAMAMQEAIGDPWGTSNVPAVWARLTDDLATARDRFRHLIALAETQGDELMAAANLAHLAETECWLGDFADAEQHAVASYELAEQAGQSVHVCFALYVLALVHAHLGRIEQGHLEAEEILAMLGDRRDPMLELRAHAVLGFIGLSTGDAEEADRRLTQAAALAEAAGMKEPAPFRFDGHCVEAAVAVGDLERAERLTDVLDERIAVLPRPWTVTMAARSRGLLSAARGDLEAAERSLEEALALHERLEMPFERARTLLFLGQVRRRRKQRRAPRQILEQALDAFEALGAQTWAERARAELERTHVREAPLGLTPTEEQVARLAASGLKNREIAAQLFLSPKTVEANLARAYRKLGIRSRAELGAAMAPPVAAPRS